MGWAGYLGKFQQSNAHNRSSYNNFSRKDHSSYANLAIIPFASGPTIQYK